MGNSADAPKDPREEPVPDDNFVVYNRKARAPLKGQLGSTACIRRGEVDLKADANRALLEVFTDRTGKQVNYVDHVRAVVDRASKRLLLIPEEAEGPETAGVHNNGSSHRIGLASILVPAKLAVEKGYTELYPVFADDHSRYGRVLVVDLANLQERRGSGKKPA